MRPVCPVIFAALSTEMPADTKSVQESCRYGISGKNIDGVTENRRPLCLRFGKIRFKMLPRLVLCRQTGIISQKYAPVR